jgi:N-acetylglucosamine-6-sulfatase
LPSLRRILIALAAACLLLAAGAASAHAQQPPNIVFVLTDDLSDDLVQYMPTVQQMQQQGVTFTNYFVTDSLCCPSRASLFTGDYPHTTDVRSNVWPTGGWQVFDDRGEESSTYATDLQSRGYRTALMGKYLNQYQPTSGHVPPGWNDWEVSGKGYHEYDYNLNVNGTVVRHGHKPSDYLTDVISRDSVSFIKDSVHSHQPFFLELSTFAPHGPATPAPQDKDKFPGLKAPRTPAWDVTPTNAPSWLQVRPPLSAKQITGIDERYRKRAQSVQAVDRMMAHVRATLARLGVAQNTYVVFTSDNGFHLGQYRLTAGKMTAFDTDVHVPLVISGPGIPPSSRVGQIAENVDLRSTFDALAGTVPGQQVEGHSLLDLMEGQVTGPWRQSALVEHLGPDLDPSDPDYQSAPGGNPTTYVAVRQQDSLYVQYDNGEREYYDLTSDPYELDNVYASLDDARRRQLAALATRLTTCTNEVACFDVPGS